MRRHRKLIYTGLVVLLVAVAISGFFVHKKVSHTIIDVSWPNCKSTPATNFQEGVIGVTDGLDFKPNPCLSKETTWFSRYALYMNTGYPGRKYGQKYMNSPQQCDSSDDACLAYNYGFAAATYGTRLAAQNGAYSDSWWLDVETDNSWTNNTQVNRAVLTGAVAAIRQNSLFATVGIYSTPDEWATITGKWHNHLPAWLGTGLLTAQAAAQKCQSNSFTGGPFWVSQYTTKLDENVTCSGAFSQRLNSADMVAGSLLSYFNQNHY
jgi:hypothetical protein